MTRTSKGPEYTIAVRQTNGINQHISFSNELILAGKLQLKKLQKKKPEKKNKKKIQASFSAISLIAVYLRGSIRYLSPAGLNMIYFIYYL